MLAQLDNIAEWPDAGRLGVVCGRLLLAALLGGLLGMERERLGKVAGLRTHVLVSMGSSLIILAALESGMNIGDLSRVIQGIATGVGFIGGGVILKLTDREEIRGVTTAANIWITCAVGMTVAAGHLWTASLGALLALIVLTLFNRLESWIQRDCDPERHLSDSNQHGQK